MSENNMDGGVVPFEAPITNVGKRRAFTANSIGRARVTLVVDASCDLPVEFLAEHRIGVLPVRLNIDGTRLLDTRATFDTIQFYQHDLATRGLNATTEPLSPRETRDILTDLIGSDSSQLVVITVTASRSQVYMHALSAAQHVSVLQRRVRKELQISDPFEAYVVDSESMFTGSAVLAFEANRLVAKGVVGEQLVMQLTRVAKHLRAFLVPNDLFYVQKRASKRGENSVSWFSARVADVLDIRPIIYFNAGASEPIEKIRGYEKAVDRMFAYARNAITRGLMSPVIVVSYAGDPQLVRAMQSFQVMESLASANGVAVLLSPMSMTAGINVGTQAVSVGFASKDTSFKD